MRAGLHLVAKLAVLACLLLLVYPSARAHAEAPRWELTISPMPTHLSPGGEGTITVIASNVGDAPVSAAKERIVLTNTLPAGLSVTEVHGRYLDKSFQPLTCSPATSKPIECVFAGEAKIKPFGFLELRLGIKNEGATSGSADEATVYGGEMPSATAAQPITVAGSPAAFGIERFEITPENEDGQPDTQAGSHPFQLTTTLGLNTTFAAGEVAPAALPRDVHVDLPPGLLGNPTAVPECTSAQFFNVENFANRCPADTAIGVATVTITGEKAVGPHPETVPVPVFNLEPAPGEPARFGFVGIVVPVVLDTAVRAGGDYGVNVTSNEIIQTAGLVSSQVTLWGVPGDPRHNASRGWSCLDPLFAEGLPPCTATEASQPESFLTLPTACAGLLTATAEADPWTAPGAFVTSGATPLASFNGCGLLPFGPTASFTPDARSARTPTGLAVAVHVPQETTRSAGDLAEATIKTTTVVLPQGIQINPASANGLEACSQQQAGFTGTIALTDQFAAELPNPFCPDAAKVGIVEEIKSPLLSNPLTGSVYLATQNTNPFGSLLALYLTAADPATGVHVELAGEVSLDQQTGQLTSTFENTPQLPFEDLKLRFFNGPVAALSTPDYCGTYTSAATFTPWSATSNVTSSSNFTITSGEGGSPCASPLPFSPTLTAHSRSSQAGAFTPFSVGIGREDSSQNLSGVSIHMPRGLLGKLASVQPCPEPQAAAGTCGPQSLIGHTNVSVGLGSEPFNVASGPVYLTGAYKGAPYGLSIAEPATAGPFDLGSGACDCVVVRARIEIDPHTAAITVVSDPLPTRLQGIPLQVKHVNVTVDRGNFTFNPTNCSQLTISSTLVGEQGGLAAPAAPFQAANCANLTFKPGFEVSTQAKTSRLNGAALHVHVTSSAGQANIAKVRVLLPQQLPSRLSTLQKACPDATFNANPAGCPPASAVGTATALTPVLKHPLTGPAYLVSHAGAAFPDLVIVLQGEGIVLDLVGNTDIKHGITSSTFNAVPDAPVTSFDLVLPQGPHSALAAFLPVKANGSMCAQHLAMPTQITGQNGAVLTQSTAIAVSGCPAHKRKRGKRGRRHAHHRAGKSGKVRGRA